MYLKHVEKNPLKKKKKKYAKLRNNAVFGKLIKNPVNKIDVKIMTTRKQYFKYSLRPTFKIEKQLCTEALAIAKGKCRNLN